MTGVRATVFTASGELEAPLQGASQLPLQGDAERQKPECGKETGIRNAGGCWVALPERLGRGRGWLAALCSPLPAPCLHGAVWEEPWLIRRWRVASCLHN